MNGPRLPWSFFLALAVLLIGCGLLGYALGFSLVVEGVNRGHSG